MNSEFLVNNSLSHRDLNVVQNAGPASSNPYWIEEQEKLSLLRTRVSKTGALQHSENVSLCIIEPLWSQLDEAAHVLSGLWGLAQRLSNFTSQNFSHSSTTTCCIHEPLADRGDMIFTTFLAGIAISIRLHGLDPVSAVALFAAHNIHFAISSPFHRTWEEVALIFLNYNVKHHLNYANNGKQSLKLGKRSGC